MGNHGAGAEVGCGGLPPVNGSQRQMAQMFGCEARIEAWFSTEFLSYRARHDGSVQAWLKSLPYKLRKWHEGGRCWIVHMRYLPKMVEMAGRVFPIVTVIQGCAPFPGRLTASGRPILRRRDRSLRTA